MTMEDYSESSSIRMEREMMHGDTSSSSHPPLDEQHPDALLDEASDSSLAAFNDEIQRMTRDADRLLNDILGSPAAALDGSSSSHSDRRDRTTTIEEEGDAELQEELEALDEVSRKISLDVVHHTLQRNRAAAAAAVDKVSSSQLRKQQPASPPADTPSLAMAVAVIWTMVLFMILHAKFRLVDADGYLRLLA